MMENAPYTEKLAMKKLEFPGDFKGDEREISDEIFENLTEEEIEILARRSYAYYFLVMTKGPLPTEVRDRVATREILHSLRGKRGEFKRALKSIQETCVDRKESQLDLLKCCFNAEAKRFRLSPSEKERIAELEEGIELELERQPMVTRGHDVEGRCIVHRYTRRNGECEEEGFIMTSLFWVERSLAATEFVSDGRTFGSSVMFHFADYKMANAPKMEYFHKALSKMYFAYPGRVHRAFLLDPPLWANTLLKLVRPIMPSNSRKKLRVAAGTSQKAKILSGYVDPSQATKAMFPEGKFDDCFDQSRALREIPFQCLYDDIYEKPQ